MKNIMKKILLPFILLGLLSTSITSCDDYLDVNKNVDAPDYVEGYLYLAVLRFKSRCSPNTNDGNNIIYSIRKSLLLCWK